MVKPLRVELKSNSDDKKTRNKKQLIQQYSTEILLYHEALIVKNIIQQAHASI